MNRSRLLFWSLSLLAAFAIAACSSRGAAQRTRGKAVYDVQCAMCHDATNLHLIKVPPRLDGMFHKSALPSGAPATDGEVRNVILHGKGIMPPFEQSISGADLDALMAYLHTR